MSEPVFAQIQIGGVFSPEQWDALLEALGLDLDRDASDYTLDPVEGAPGCWYFDYWNAFANYGNFEEAEALLKEHGLPYDKQYEGNGEQWGAGQERYRPGQVEIHEHRVGSDLAITARQVKQLIASTRSRPQLVQALLRELGDEVPPLPPLTLAFDPYERWKEQQARPSKATPSDD